MDRVDQRTRLLDYIREVFADAGAAWGGLLERGLGRLLERTVIRRLSAPGHVAIVGVGGATMGGSGKTPLAIECAAELARAGARVVLVGHAYRADPRRPRYVSPGDALEDVGDEALLAARMLAPLGARVVVAPTREAAMALAGIEADVLVLDGVAQLAAARVALSILAVDATEPWGRPPSLPPRGTLRAPIPTLLAACDVVVPIGGAPLDRLPAGLGRSVWPATIESKGARVHAGALMTWETLRPLRVGLLVAVGRPERLVRFLAHRGIAPRAVVRAPDHGPFAMHAPALVALASRFRGIDLWLATPKCALHAERRLPALPVAVIDRSVALHPSLRTRLRGMRGLPPPP
jgi:tetraacyldisaccharide 4'-kinase